MTDAKTTRELVYETNRDVKWICKTLARMEVRLRILRPGSGRWSGGSRRSARGGGGAGAGVLRRGEEGAILLIAGAATALQKATVYKTYPIRHTDVSDYEKVCSS